MVSLFSKMSDLAIGSSQLITAYISGKVVGETGKDETFTQTEFSKTAYFFCPDVNKECEEVELFSFSPSKAAEYKLVITSVEIEGLFELNQNLYMNVGASKFNEGVISGILFVNIANFVLALLALLMIRSAVNKVVGYVGYEQGMVFNLAVLLVLKNQPLSSISLEISESLYIVEFILGVLFSCYLIYFWITMLSVSPFP